jgi:hypothetical protein
MLDVVRMIAPVEFVSCGLEIWIWIEKRYLRELSKANKNRKRPGGVVTGMLDLATVISSSRRSWRRVK